MISNKKTVQYLLKFCKDLQIKNWVLSPGSRNAPITLTLGNDSFFNCESIVDERSAAFIALGMSIASKNITAISCTSGSASLNYAPAISEAYYQNIPLLIVTSDRPQKWIGNGEGQCINQIEVYKNFVKNSYHLDEDNEESQIVEVFESIKRDLTLNVKGPVHLNLAFDEPLYGISENANIHHDFLSIESLINLENSIDFNDLSNQWKQYSKVMILCGQMEKDEKLLFQLKELNQAPKVVILTESLSNISDFFFVNCIDRTLENITNDEKFAPELVITIGGAIISKKIKQYLRSVQNLEHWQVSLTRNSENIFECLTHFLNISESDFFRKIISQNDFESESLFNNNWMQASRISEIEHDKNISGFPWSDLKAFQLINDFLPEDSIFHLGNSSPVRYVQLFNPIASVNYQGNRGVSGIDGCSSTALGYSLLSDKLNVLVSGDLSFVYDINAFWNHLDKNNLKIIIINNGGGGIFRIIPGPKSTQVMESRFEVGNALNIKVLCEAYQLNYFSANSEETLEDVLNSFFIQDSQTADVLEIFTPNTSNAEVLNDYFKKLRI